MSENETWADYIQTCDTMPEPIDAWVAGYRAGQSSAEQRVKELEADLCEQARLRGVASAKEINLSQECCDLQAKCAELERERDALMRNEHDGLWCLTDDQYNALKAQAGEPNVTVGVDVTHDMTTVTLAWHDSNGVTHIKDCKQYPHPSTPAAEPSYFGLTRDHTWLSIDKKKYDKLKPEMRMAVINVEPKETT